MQTCGKLLFSCLGLRVKVYIINEKEKKSFAFDLKALWDYKCYVIIIGVWSQSGYLTTLNSDLLSRIKELSIVW